MFKWLQRLFKGESGFWWNTLMVFCACRATDLINLFIGVWMVPHYILPDELGAVLPLATMAQVVAVPATAFTLIFMREVNLLAGRKEFGKLKTLLRGVFSVTALLLLVTILLVRLAMPLFMRKLRLEEGSLGLIIISSALITGVAPIYANTMQALKRFRALSLASLLGAVMRLVVMVVLVPFRALSGYLCAQNAPPLVNIGFAILSLRKELAVRAAEYWQRDVVRRLTFAFLAVLGCQLAGGWQILIEQTFIRERLCSMDSAAYYMITRFSEIAGYIACTFTVVMFPYTAEAAAAGRSTLPIFLRASAVTCLGGVFIALAFELCGARLIAILPHGADYATYVWSAKWFIIYAVFNSIALFHFNTEVSAARYRFVIWWIPFHLLCAGALLFFADRFTSLIHFCYWFVGTAILRCVFIAFDLRRPLPH